MFEISTERVPIPIDDLPREGFTTLLCGGIVNPFGPTLTTIAVLGEAKVGQTLDLVELMLNPFSQEAHRVGSATIGETWNPTADCAPLIEVPHLGGCPTLLLPSSQFDSTEAVEIHAKWLLRFPGAGEQWRMIQKYPSDPWNRISEEMNDATREAAVSKTMNSGADGEVSWPDAVAFATFVISDKHTFPELQAFMNAWKGSIDFCKMPGALQLDEFGRWLGLISSTTTLVERLEVTCPQLSFT